MPHVSILEACPSVGEFHANGNGEATDRELLDRFVRDGEEGAFALLVRRHAASVLAVSRRVLRHEQDAEDVCQGVFLLLARKARHVAWETSIRKWLAVAAYRLALNARGIRRRIGMNGYASASLDSADELPARCEADGDPLTKLTRQELRAALDAELYELPEKYRAPVVLCYLQGKSNAEAARLLGWPAGSMSRRLGRARALLCQRLTRRGLA